MTDRDKGIGIALVVIGGFLLLTQTMNVNVGAFAWPLFVLVPGVLMLAAAFMAQTSLSSLAIPGSIVTAIGLILFFQNVTGRFETWAYVWALIPAAVGVGVFIQGTMTADEELRANGRRLMAIGLALLVGFGLFFELLVFNAFGNSFVWRYLLPVVLVVGGVFLLMRRSREREGAPPQPPVRREEPPRRPPEPEAQ